MIFAFNTIQATCTCIYRCYIIVLHNKKITIQIVQIYYTGWKRGCIFYVFKKSDHVTDISSRNSLKLCSPANYFTCRSAFDCPGNTRAFFYKNSLALFWQIWVFPAIKLCNIKMIQHKRVHTIISHAPVSTSSYISIFTGVHLHIVSPWQK